MVKIVRLRRIDGSCDSASHHKFKFEIQILARCFYSVLKMHWQPTAFMNSQVGKIFQQQIWPPDGILVFLESLINTNS